MQIEITKQSEKDFRFLLSRLSHEIRNPVTLINSELQLMASSHPELCSYRQWDSLMDNLEYVKELLKELEKLSGEKVELTVRRGGRLQPCADSYSCSRKSRGISDHCFILSEKYSGLSGNPAGNTCGTYFFTCFS